MTAFLLRRLVYLVLLVIISTSMAYVLAATQLNPRSRYEGRNPPPPPAYKTMIASCYSCHKAVGRPYLRPMIPTAPAMTVINLDTNATWPE